MADIGKIKGAAGEARANFAADATQRKSAGQSARSIILHPGEVRGEYEAARLLMTTLGGKPRIITHEDLATFRQNVRNAQRQFKGGITARQVLDLSLEPDRQRAREQIKMAVPAGAKNGVVRFITNSGPNSDVPRHHVAVEFTAFDQAVASGAMSAKQAAAWVRKQPIRFDCDCSRTRYWFRYIATIGGYNMNPPYGRPETGFPKIRNPRLTGVACKHALRVMAEIESSAGILAFLTKLIEKARANDDGAAQIRNTQKDAEALAKKQASRVRDIKTSAIRQNDREAARAKKALQEAAKKAPAPKKRAAATRKASTTEGAAAILAKQFNMTPAQVMSLLAAQKK